MSLLRLESMEKSFGGLRVTQSVSLTLQEGARVGLIGPNGAGKTTLVNLISGVLRPDAGRIRLEGNDVTSLPQAARVRAGLARTFQITTLPAELPVLRQVEMALHQRDGLASAMWRPVESFASVRAEAAAILAQLGLQHAAPLLPGELSYGEQRMVELALALALRPRVLLLDEPMAGVAKSEARTVLDALEKLPPQLALLVIEHDMDFVFRFASHIVVLAEGAVIAQGSPDAIRRDPAVRSAYLGNAS